MMFCYTNGYKWAQFFPSEDSQVKSMTKAYQGVRGSCAAGQLNWAAELRKCSLPLLK